MPSLKKIAYLLRLSHWSKAAFIFLGVIYSGLPEYFLSAFLAALAFCLLSSAVYIYNDLQDREHDRAHPQKCNRPLAAGEISLVWAVSLLIFLLVGGILLAWLISSILAAILGIYLIINLAYNYILKQIPVLDVLCIASGFMLRVLAGTIGIGLPISWWLTITATLISLFIAFCKRRLEKQLSLNSETRAVLKRYSQSTLDLLITITAVSSFISYLLYTLLVRDESFYFLITLPFAAIGIWRFAWLSTRTSFDDDPISIFFDDALSRFNLLCFISLTLVALANG
ncbi:4-hydroxybenzoate octaprenyltransferase [Legionella beliardensis]|uniref:4-hydroxybenzoate octaprenyltransferase n=1 Tax=Legionella beliardensis TaxID=91822 RepID=A0A378I1U0_9GAMM|nr:decaprenyl-phosphate phosphoribosyltransferase [Legionella beliardensis]STX28645.1 4-hydroxybenzoate octaprenyltransferase [Legionella beliardensis]